LNTISLVKVYACVNNSLNDHTIELHSLQFLNLLLISFTSKSLKNDQSNKYML